MRDRTSHAHRAVDEAVGAFDDLASYSLYLRGLAAFRQPLEAQLARAAWPAALGEWRPTAVGTAILADMADLGVTASSSDAEDLNFSGDELFGALYVLEGSTLGARVLFERARALGLSAEFGARHLALLSGSIDGWRGFLDRLEATEPFDIERAVAASMTVFARARAAFEAPAHG